MGFGTMLLGGLFMLLGAFTTFSPFTYVLGSALILYSMKELVLQNKVFFSAIIVAALEFILSMVYMFFYVLSPQGLAISYFSVAVSSLGVILTLLILTAIYLLAKEVELPSIQTKIIITYIITGIYVACVFFTNVIFKNNAFVVSRLSVVCVFSQLIYSIMFVVVVANSYMRICYEDDKNMNKSSKGFLGFLNDELNVAMTPKEKRDIDKGDDEK